MSRPICSMRKPTGEGRDMTAPPARQPLDLMQLLTRAERLMARRLTAILDTEGYSLEAWRVITLLADGTGHHMTEIAEHAFLPPATLTKLVDLLVDNNVVYRRGDDPGRRRRRPLLTPPRHPGVRPGHGAVPAAVRPPATPGGGFPACSRRSGRAGGRSGAGRAPGLGWLRRSGWPELPERASSG